jgi:tripartite-type tricarboxylate transporter receptor subunit TctC
MARVGGSTHSTAVAPGKPDKRRNEYKQAVKQVFNEQDFIALLETLKQEALSGNIRALELALSYTIGKPTEKMEVTQIEPKEFEVHIVDDVYHIGDKPAIKFEG